MIEKQLEIKVLAIRKIDINHAAWYQLRNHPYIDDDLAELIVAYRNQHGRYESVDELRNLALMNDELFERLSPYLAVF
jgi:DNA uptake protein ComE-like DNA-binding protein